MSEEISVLLEVAAVLEGAGVHYMLTGSMALNVYAMPRMTRDIDLVAVVALADAARMETLFPPDRFYVSAEAARDAVRHQSSFNIIQLATMTKVDIMIRRREEFRVVEFDRRRRVEIRGTPVWVVSKEDLILAKLDWARDSLSERQLGDVKNLLATGCDLDYVKAWAQRLQLNDMLTRVLP